MFCVKGKNVLVTGGAKGIGYMISKGFVEAGANVIVTGREEKALTRVAKELGCRAIRADLAKEEDVRNLVKQLGDAVSATGLHVLINNAGANWGAPFDEYADSAFERVLNLNVKKVFLLTRLLAPLLAQAATDEDNPARVINIGSIDGIRIPALETFAYSASKAALHHLTRTLASHLATRRILVNAVAPGPFESKMMADTLKRFKDSIVAGIPVGRIGVPQDMAAICIFLASAGSSFITGAVIPVDGGILVRSNL